MYTALEDVVQLGYALAPHIRDEENKPPWLTLSTIIPKKISALFVLIEASLMVWQIQKSQYWNEWAEIADVSEYGEAAALGHTFQSLMWGLALFYTICLLTKQIVAIHRAKHKQNTENLI